MKACIVGAGAIGGLVGARLAQSGCEVSAIARGATAAALRARASPTGLSTGIPIHGCRASATSRRMPSFAINAVTQDARPAMG